MIENESSYKVNMLLRLAGSTYRAFIRPLLSDAKAVEYSGIPVAINKKIGDDLMPRAMLPFMHYDIADYEATLIGALRSAVQEGDRIVIVGGGLGVTAVAAARATGRSGSVICFEGSAYQIRQMQVTFARNQLTEAIELRHAIVAKDIGVYGKQDESVRLLPPAKLPVCDVLELDCEGAEIPILEGLTFRPRAIVVETHGLHNAPTLRVRALLEQLGYEIEDRGWAEPSRLGDCTSGDIRILLGRNRSSPKSLP